MERLYCKLKLLFQSVDEWLNIRMNFCTQSLLFNHNKAEENLPPTQISSFHPQRRINWIFHVRKDPRNFLPPQVVGRPTKLTCNYVKFRTEAVREIAWYAGYNGINTKVSSRDRQSSLYNCLAPFADAVLASANQIKQDWEPQSKSTICKNINSSVHT